MRICRVYGKLNTVPVGVCCCAAARCCSEPAPGLHCRVTRCVCTLKFQNYSYHSHSTSKQGCLLTP